MDTVLNKTEETLSEAYRRLAKAQDQFLRQKTKIEWLNKGDLNTSYFHSSLRNRRAKNKVVQIRDVTNNLCDDTYTINNAFLTYYKTLLGQSHQVNKVHKKTIRQGTTVNKEHHQDLLATPTDEEIKRAFFSIPVTKAPGPDGYSSHFFKHSWGDIGPDVCRAIHDFFRNGKLLKQINATQLTLIPKMNHPQNVTHFRPIACCNVVYKAISKILCNRLNVVLPYIISNNQSAFVKDRDIVDNILICHDIVRHYNRKACSPRAMLKIDLQKAYDSIEWPFIEQMLNAMNFPHHFTRLIMQCVTTPWYSINLNGSVFGFFKGERGLRQGDPISPLIFLLCMEYLTRLLNLGQHHQGFTYHPMCKKVHLNHLMFADDLLIFAKGDPPSISFLMKAFNTFSAASGMKMSQMKSNIYIAGVKESMAQKLVNITGVPRGQIPFKYLGVPISSKKISKRDSHQLVEKIVERIHALGARKLSYGGRLVLIKNVLSTLHSYWARIFVLPSSTIKEINAICRNFLWQGSEHYNSAPPIAWEQVCQPRKAGGLGIVSAHDWNIAALGKYVWWVAHKKDTLWVKWINAVYLRGKEWMDYEPNSNASWVWRKLCMVRDKLKMGYNGTTWQAQGGIYRIRDGYELLRPTSPEVQWHKFVWNRTNIPKQSFIAWIIAHERLRTKDRLSYLNLQDKTCPICKNAPETHQHLFFACQFSSTVRQKIEQWIGIELPKSSPANWWINKRMASLLHKQYIATIISSMMYHIWRTRNECRIHQQVQDPGTILKHIKAELQALLKADDKVRSRKHQNWARRLLE